jgi:hypothetical protein
MKLCQSNYRMLFVVALFTLVVGRPILRPAFDADTWWHLRIGQLIDQTRTLPTIDPLSRVGVEEGKSWQAYSWLFEWLLFRCWESNGIDGVLTFRVALVALSVATVFSFVVTRFGATLTATAILFAISLPLAPMATERPWHFTIVFTTMTFRTVQAARESGNTVALWSMIPVFTLWSNLHIQFILGFLILALACIDPGLARRRSIILVSFACGLASFVNPYHMKLIFVIWDYATHTAHREIIQELAPPDPFAAWTVSTFGMLIVAAIQVRKRNRPALFEWGVVLIGAVFASRMNRDLWFGALAAVAVLRPEDSRNGNRSLPIVCVIIVVLGVLRAFHSLGLVGDNNTLTANAQAYPVGAAAFVGAKRPPGPLYNDITWGGYLAWALPEYPVTIDGRTNLYGNEGLRQSSLSWSTRDGWKSDREFAKCRIVIARVGRPLTEELLNRQKEWHVAYQDAVAIVFLRIE